MNMNMYLGIGAGIIIVAIGGWLVLGGEDAPQNMGGTPENGTTTQQVVQEPNTIPMENPTVTLSTSLGDITLELFLDSMPITAGNFLKLAREGYYTNTKFHRVIPNFMIQGGDPLTKDDTQVARWGTGGPGYTIEDEFVSGLSNVRGTIAMANAGPGTGGSQFFINVVDNKPLDFDVPDPYNSAHPVFGKVVGGMEIVDAISKLSRGARDVPNTPVVITKVTITEGQ